MSIQRKINQKHTTCWKVICLFQLVDLWDFCMLNICRNLMDHQAGTNKLLFINLRLQQAYLPAGRISAFVGRLPKNVKRNRKKFIVDQPTVYRKYWHQQEDIAATKQHLHKATKFLMGNKNYDENIKVACK